MTDPITDETQNLPDLPEAVDAEPTGESAPAESEVVETENLDEQDVTEAVAAGDPE